MGLTVPGSFAFLMFVACSEAMADTVLEDGAASDSRPAEQGIVTMGPAAYLRSGSPTVGCTNPTARFQPDVFPSNVGEVTSIGGSRFAVPAPITAGLLATDLYNDCTGVGENPDWEAQLQTVIIDEDGVEVTGFIFADNYYELYVNGQFVARDPVAMTPFNSTVVRFRASYPMTLAIMGVDWETHPGLGMEYDNYQIGDGGFVAYFSDGNRTTSEWHAETFYIAPLDDPACVRTVGQRDSTFCSQAVRPACATEEPSSCRALHFPIPSDWAQPGFDASGWPQAVVWPAGAVTNARAYVGYSGHFVDAEFIWTRNLRLDNLVLARHTAKGPQR